MWFLGLKVERICEEINSAKRRVIYVAPGIRKTVSEAIIKTVTRLGPDSTTVIVDCDETSCRLGYGDTEAIKLLTSKGVIVRQSKGLRFGLLICDDRGLVIFTCGVVCGERYSKYRNSQCNRSCA